MDTKEISLATFQSMLSSAGQSSGVTAQGLATKLQSKGYTLGKGLESFQAGKARPTAPTYNPAHNFDPNVPQTKEQGFFSTVGNMAAKTAEYIASPINAAAGLITQGIGSALGTPQEQLNQSLDVRNLQKNADMARTALPLTVGLATAPLSLPAGALATGIAGFAGRGVKETADATTGADQQSVAGRIGDSIKEGAVTGLTDLAVGKALKIAGKAAGKLLSPFASRFDPEIAALSQKAGITLPVSSLSKSNAVKQLETVAQKGFAGGAAEQQVEVAGKKLMSMSDKLVSGLGGSSDFTVAGKSVIEGADAFRDTWRATKNKAYDLAKELLQKGDNGSFIPDTKNTVAVIDEILSGKNAASTIIGDAATSDTTTAILQTIRKNLASGETKSLEAFTSSLDELNKMTKFGNTLISTGDQAVLKKVIATLDGDVTNGLRAIAPKAAKALDSADSIYKKGIQLLDSTFGDRIAKLSDNPTKIVDQLITPKSVDDVPRIFKLIGTGKNGPQRIADVKTSFARKIVDKSIGQDGVIGNALENEIERYGESTVKAVIGEDGLQALREIQKLSSALNRGQSVAKGSQTAFVTKITALMGAIFTLNVPAAAAIVGGDVALSKLFNTQWFRTWLTKGFEASPVAEGAARIGGELMQRAAVGTSQQFTE